MLKKKYPSTANLPQTLLGTQTCATQEGEGKSEAGNLGGETKFLIGS